MDQYDALAAAVLFCTAFFGAMIGSLADLFEEVWFRWTYGFLLAMFAIPLLVKIWLGMVLG